jgi:hypothetical protein
MAGSVSPVVCWDDSQDRGGRLGSAYAIHKVIAVVVPPLVARFTSRIDLDPMGMILLSKRADSIQKFWCVVRQKLLFGIARSAQDYQVFQLLLLFRWCGCFADLVLV